MGANKIIDEVIYRINVNKGIENDLLRSAFYTLLTNRDIKHRDLQLGCLLTGLMAKGPTVDEVVTMVETALKLDDFSINTPIQIDLPNNKPLIGAIGSGKKGIKTMNISTPSMIVASTTGVYTAKPGSKATASITGSADLLRALGVNIDISLHEMIDVVKKEGFGLFPIENLIPRFDEIYGGKFYTPTVLSFGLPALITPIKLDNLLYGVAHPNISLAAKTLHKFGYKNVMCVSCTHDNIHYLDEMGVYGVTKIIGIKNGEIGEEKLFQPLDMLNLPKYTPLDIIQGDTIEKNVKYAVDVLKGECEGAREDIVCINAGTLVYLAGMASDLKEGYELCKHIVEDGKPFDKLKDIIKATGGSTENLERYE